MQLPRDFDGDIYVVGQGFTADAYSIDGEGLARRTLIDVPIDLGGVPILTTTDVDGGVFFVVLSRTILQAFRYAGTEWTDIGRERVEAGFPDVLTLDNFDFRFANGVDKKQMLELARGNFVDDRTSSSSACGTSKTHLATALGIEAARRRQRVTWFRAADLVSSLLEVGLDGAQRNVNPSDSETKCSQLSVKPSPGSRLLLFVPLEPPPK